MQTGGRTLSGFFMMEADSPARHLYCGRSTLKLDRPAIMGIVNLTPDSFSGDGKASDIRAAIRHAEAQIAAGADILDLGAESSRPGAEPLPLDEELARLLPVLDALRDCPVPLSIDTYKPEVMRAALDAGASIINDIYAFRRPGAFELVARYDCALCLMHMQGEPLAMQRDPRYDNVVLEVESFFRQRIHAAKEAGIPSGRCWIDPGFGFGKALEHNITLFQALDRLVMTGAPVLVGVSRKSMLGALSGRTVAERGVASVVAAALAMRAGAAVVRVHDVGETLDALKITLALDAGVWEKTGSEL